MRSIRYYTGTNHIKKKLFLYIKINNSCDYISVKILEHCYHILILVLKTKLEHKL